MGRGKGVSDQIRAAVISDLLTTNDDQYVIAERYGISSSFVSRLKKKIPDEVLERRAKEVEEIASAQREIQEVRDSIPFLIEKHLRSSLEAGIKITEQLNNDEWRDKQSASDLTELYVATTDRSIRILTAIETANERRHEREIERQKQIQGAAVGADHPDGSRSESGVIEPEIVRP